MFTGIVKEIGTIKELRKTGSGYRITVDAKKISTDAGIGDSIAVNGVCLTLTEKKGLILSFDVMDQTVRHTAIASLKPNDPVNLEDAVGAGEKMGGHFVQGHIDYVGRISRMGDGGAEFFMEISMPAEMAHLIVAKGSVAIDGVSLTVGDAKVSSFIVYLIPHTLKATTLSLRRVGDSVNVELDIVGKYISRKKELEGTSRISESFLKSRGF